MNFTAIPRTGALGYITVWPLGQSRPTVSTLNAPTGVVTANAAIVPAGYIGNIAAYPTNDTDLVIDVNGYFAPAGAGGLSLYPTAPCRVHGYAQVDRRVVQRNEWQRRHRQCVRPTGYGTRHTFSTPRSYQ